MGSESSSATASTSSPSAKRSRDPEDEVYVDNLHSHKRYLSEIMACSLNGLTVGDSLPDNIMEFPARDETPLQYSPMSEDSDDSRFCEYPTTTCSSQPESVPTSPVSPYRYQKPLSAFSSAASSSSHACPSGISSQPRQRGSDSEGRFPSSPSDICHSGDLRKAALLRSVQMRTHPAGPPSFVSQFCSEHEAGNLVDVEEQRTPFGKSTEEDREYQNVDCSSIGAMDNDLNCRAKTRKVLDMNKKGDDS